MVECNFMSWVNRTISASAGIQVLDRKSSQGKVREALYTFTQRNTKKKKKIPDNVKSSTCPFPVSRHHCEVEADTELAFDEQQFLH